MIATRTFGRMPTLGEMRDYYARDDVLSFLYDECQMRNIDIAFRRKRWPINPTSKNHLREIIEKTIEDKIERSYRHSDVSVENVRLEKFDYLSFHFRTSITSGEKLMGFDTIFEADLQGWRRAFEDLVGVIKLLDDFGVCYRIKYSGVRSLHFMIPFESFPKQFNGKPVLGQRIEIQSKIQNYLRRRCGMERAHGGGVMRLAYSLNEDNGLVSLPISSDELPLFRPWKANIHNVTMDKPWHGDVPSGASRNMLKFLREVYSENAGDRGKSRKISCRLEIRPKERSDYGVGAGTAEEWRTRLKSDGESDRVEAAWNLMVTPETVPISALAAGLSDENPDVRWYLTESLQKRLDADAIELAGRMLWDDDQFVRISAIDALVLSGEDALQAVSNSMSDAVNAAISPMGAINDVIYAIRRICPEDEPEALQSFIKPIGDSVARFLLAAIDSDQPFWVARRCIRQLRELCKQHNIEESELFRRSIEMIVPRLLNSLSMEEPGHDEIWVPYHRLWALQEIRRNKAIPMIVMQEMADSLNIDAVKIPANRMTHEERTFLTRVVRESLADMTLRQRVSILIAFWQRCGKKLSEPAGNLLMYIEQIDPSVVEWTDNAKARVHGIKFMGKKELMQDKSVDELIEMLSQHWRIRTAAIYALAEKCSTDEDIENVISALQSGSTKARTGAVTALGLMMPRHKKAREAITEALTAQGRTLSGHPFTRWDIRRAALKIYTRSNPPDAVDVLLHAVDEWRSATARYDAVAELGRHMDDERALGKLRQIVADERFPRRARIKAEKLLERVPE